jgi:hypothetical protein
MNPTDTIIALEKALEAGPTPGEWSLWGPAEPSQVIAHASGFIAQTVGGNDIPNAQWIAACSPLAIRTLLDAHASALRDATRYRWLRDSCLDWDGNSDDGKWAALHFECQEGILNAYVPATLDASIDRAAALDDNTKGAAPELAGLGINGSRCGTHGTSGS